MATPVVLPRQGQSVESCIFTEWHVNVGEEVHKGDLLYTYETDKAAFEGEAPEDGILLAVFAGEGDEIRILSTIAVIGKEGENYEEYIPSEKGSEQGPIETTAGEKKPLSGTGVSNFVKNVEDNSDIIRISPRARRTAERFKMNYFGIAGTGPYGRIIERDIQANVANMPKATPLARSISYIDQLDLPSTGSGEGGKVVSGDLRKRDQLSGEAYNDIKISNIRKIIADNMHASLQNTAQLTLHASADARKIQGYRKVIKKALDQGGTDNITINDMICFAVINALKKHPDINAHFLGDRIRQFIKINLGFAVDTPRGLMVPTLKNADDLSISLLSMKAKELVSRIQEGKIDPDLLQGATFTVTNLGAMGIEMFTPVLNPPQVAILGVNKITIYPEDIGEGVIAFVPRIGLSLTFDHRAIDGAPAARFLQEVVNQIENLEIS